MSAEAATAPTTTPAQAPAPQEKPTAGDAAAKKAALTGDELVQTLKTQIEFYFSQQNLANDSYLRGQMNAEKYVPVDVIANFNKVKSLTTDRSVLLDVIRSCGNCALDETNSLVRPSKAMVRDTLILRDIPKDTPVEDVKSIFAFEKSGVIVDIRPDIEDTWFVKFETEEACTKTAMALIGRTFQGKPVRARVKAAHLVRGFYQQPPRQPNPGANSFRPQNGRGQQQQQQQWQEQQQQQGGNGYYYNQQYAANAAYGQWNQNDAAMYGAAGGYGKGMRRGPGGAPMQGMQGQMSAQVVPSGDGKKKANKAKKGRAAGAAGAAGGKPGAGRQGQGQGQTGKGPRPALGPEHFPALPTSKTTRESGYVRPFQKYSREVMAALIEKLSTQGFDKPSGLPDPDECVAIRRQPKLESQLLKPFPIMYPASPSPMLQPQPKDVLAGAMPDLDLGPKETSSAVATTQSPLQRPQKPWVPLGAKPLVGGGGIHAALRNRQPVAEVKASTQQQQQKEQLQKKQQEAATSAAAAEKEAGAAPAADEQRKQEKKKEDKGKEKSPSDGADDTGGGKPRKAMSYADLLKKK